MKAFDDLLPVIRVREQCAFRIGNGYGSQRRCKKYAIPRSLYCRQHDLKRALEQHRRLMAHQGGRQ